MPVNEDHIRGVLELHEGAEQSRRFPERQETGNVRERDVTLDDDRFDRLSLRKGEDDDTGMNDVAVLLERRIGAGNQPGTAHPSPLGHLGPYLFLNPNCFLGCHLPGVKSAHVHGRALRRMIHEL